MRETWWWRLYEERFERGAYTESRFGMCFTLQMRSTAEPTAEEGQRQRSRSSARRECIREYSNKSGNLCACAVENERCN